MKAFASMSGGLCVFEEKQQRQCVNVVDMSVVAPETAHLVCGAIDDWEIIDFPDREAVLREVTNRCHCARGLANIEVCLTGVSVELEIELLGEVEDILKGFDVRSRLEAMLLRAPLVSTDGLTGLVEECLSEGLGSTASLLEYVRESQPLLRRLAAQWLSIPDQLFAGLSGGRQQVWRMAIDAGVVPETLVASTFQATESAWVKLVFGLALPAERVVMTRVSKAVATALFPDHAESRPDVSAMLEVDPRDSSDESRLTKPRPRHGHASYVRALKQVEGITVAVAGGHDANARQFLKELVAAQMSFGGGEDHAVKSICNIAQQCAEMFRTDFEYECLETAISIKPGDAWTLVQIADHFKRVGRFDDAIATLRQAEVSGEERIAKSSLADVYVQMGRFQEAIAIYENISGAQQDVTIRQAKADLLRRWGRFDDAGREYDGIILDGLATHRVFAGQAEIAKRQGCLTKARKLYLELLESTELDASSAVIYRMALANVLLRTGDLSDAYRLADEVVQMRPFSQQAKTLRAAIAGLLGKPDEAIRDLPQLGQTRAFKEWVSEYVRGLLLLMLNRYDDARVALLRNVERRFLDEDANGILRLAAAVCFLQTSKGVKDAAKVLNEVSDMHDAFADSIRAALQYHVAVALRQDAEIERIKMQLISVDDDDVKTLVTAINHREWKTVCLLEVQALLRLAA